MVDLLTIHLQFRYVVNLNLYESSCLKIVKRIISFVLIINKVVKARISGIMLNWYVVYMSFILVRAVGHFPSTYIPM